MLAVDVALGFAIWAGIAYAAWRVVTRLRVSGTTRELPAASFDDKTCPDCAEDVKAAARVCRFCGYRFTEVPPALRPTSYQPSGQADGGSYQAPSRAEGSRPPVALGIIGALIVLAGLAAFTVEAVRTRTANDAATTACRADTARLREAALTWNRRYEAQIPGYNTPYPKDDLELVKEPHRLISEVSLLHNLEGHGYYLRIKRVKGECQDEVIGQFP